jgi:hypothetical protein
MRFIDAEVHRRRLYYIVTNRAGTPNLEVLIKTSTMEETRPTRPEVGQEGTRSESQEIVFQSFRRDLKVARPQKSHKASRSRAISLPRVRHRLSSRVRWMSSSDPLEQIVQPGGAGPFFEGHRQSSAQSREKLKNRGRFCLQDGFHHVLPVRSNTATEIVD